jgi:hypothetical protein
VESCRTVGGHLISLFSHLLARSEADFLRPLFTPILLGVRLLFDLPLFTPVLTGVRQRSFAVVASE